MTAVALLDALGLERSANCAPTSVPLYSDLGDLAAVGLEDDRGLVLDRLPVGDPGS